MLIEERKLTVYGKGFHPLAGFLIGKIIIMGLGAIVGIIVLIYQALN